MIQVSKAEIIDQTTKKYSQDFFFQTNVFSIISLSSLVFPLDKVFTRFIMDM